MKAAFAVLLTLCLVACQQDSSELRSRVAVWSQRLTELPAGSSSSQIQRWAASHKVHFTFLSEQRQFYANVERVPVKACTSLAASGTSSSRSALTHPAIQQKVASSKLAPAYEPST